MDLLQTVRKEGSRGGVNFSWDDVKTSGHRENYLGHSLMAPVGRWQKGKDLSWYARAEDADLTPEQRAEKAQMERREELRRVKEAEEDAMARALGLPVPDRSNANLEPVTEGRVQLRAVEQAVKASLADDAQDRGGRRGHDERSRVTHRRRDRSGSRDKRRRSDHKYADDRRQRASRSRSRDRERERDRHRRRRSRSRSPPRREHRRHRSRDADARNHRDGRSRSRAGERDRKRDRSRTHSPDADRRRYRDKR